MVKASRIFILTAVAASAFPVFAGEWSERAEVRGRRGAVVAYRAKVDGDTLIVEAAHEPGWHTYAMDNVRRAQEKTGKEQPETELPTVIAVTGGLSRATGVRRSRRNFLRRRSSGTHGASRRRPALPSKLVEAATPPP